MTKKQKTDLKNWKWPYHGGGELSCPHGVGHGGVHTCDGCCAHPSFKEAHKRNQRTDGDKD